MAETPTMIRLRQEHDQTRAVLRSCLKALPSESVSRILADLEREYRSPETDTEDRFAAHAMLVGIVDVMLADIDAKEETP